MCVSVCVCVRACVCVADRQAERQRDGRVKSINREMKKKGGEEKERERGTLAVCQEREKGKSSKGRNPD